MEALTAVSVAGLTVYDMAKAVDRGMRIDAVRLREKGRRPLGLGAIGVGSRAGYESIESIEAGPAPIRIKLIHARTNNRSSS